MRALFLLGLLVLGLAASGAAVVRSRSPLRPRSPFSLSERLLALRINRDLPPEARKTASLSLGSGKALFEVRDEVGATLLRCPADADLAVQYASFATTGAARGCEAEAADDGADVRLYDASARASAPLPGEASTLIEHQLEDALFLPALQLQNPGQLSAMKPGRLVACAAGQSNCALSLAAFAIVYCGDVRTCAEGACFQGRSADIQPDDIAVSLAQAQIRSSRAQQISEAITPTTAAQFIEAPPWGTQGPGSAEMAHDLRAFFDHHPRGLCLYLRGLDVERPRDAQVAADALSFPVLAPFDPRAPDRKSPLLARLTPGSCDLPSEEACADKRARTSAQFQAALGKLLPPLAATAHDELAYHVGSSGPFELTAFDGLRVRLSSKAEVSKGRSQRGRLTVSYQPLWAESVAERRARCEAQGTVCVFRTGDFFAIPPEQAEAAQSPTYLLRLLDAWAAR
ncbi:MAG TPA: hypothetical protein VGH20_11910 [Myxococcales bacterium]